jgi:hypothetical protein
MSPTPEQIELFKEFISQLNEKERNDLLNSIHSSGIQGMKQFNSDKAKASQVEVNGGTAYIGEFYIDNLNIDIDSIHLENTIRGIIADLAQSSTTRDYLPNTIDGFSGHNEYEFQEETVDLFEHDQYESHYTVPDYNLLSSVGYFPIIMVVLALIGISVFFSGVFKKTAVVTTSNPKGVNVKDDSARIIETLPSGTIVTLTGERDSINYCKTNRGWIYCNFLVENDPGKSAGSQQAIADRSITSQKTAIVQPDSPHDSAKLRIQPNSGKVIGAVAKGSQVQVIQCGAEACEITNGSIRGWVYRPYLRQQ